MVKTAAVTMHVRASVVALALTGRTVEWRPVAKTLILSMCKTSPLCIDVKINIAV